MQACGECTGKIGIIRSDTYRKMIYWSCIIFREIYDFLRVGKEGKMGHVIDVVNVSKRFGSETVVNDVSLSLDKGKIYGILGRNGS